MLLDRDILYCVDYVINAGGIINISYEKQGYDKTKALKHTERIGSTLLDIFHTAHKEGRTPGEVADSISCHAMLSQLPALNPVSAWNVLRR